MQNLCKLAEPPITAKMLIAISHDFFFFYAFSCRLVSLSGIAVA